MSAISNIVAFDGAATPVSHTFVPVSVTRANDEIIADYRENLSGVPTYACPSVRVSLKRLPSGIYQADTRVSIPVMESVSGQNSAGYTAAPKVAYTNTVLTRGLFHERSDQAGRRLVRQLAVNIDGSIATSVTPVATGPVPELIDQLVAPT